jgi:hypothetical protein
LDGLDRWRHHLQRLKHPLQPGIEEPRLTGTKPFIIAERANGLAERNMDVDAVLCLFRSGRVRDQPSPDLGIFFFTEALDWAMKVAQTRCIGQGRDLPVAILEATTSR